MARKIGVEFEGAFYHVIGHSQRGQAVNLGKSKCLNLSEQ
jgi:hypothetical protein